MMDNTTPAGEPGKWAGSSLFAILAGSVCMLAGWGLAALLVNVAGLREWFVAFRTDDAELYLLIALSLIIIFTAQPVGWGQRRLFALTVFLQSFAYYAAATIAGFAQTVIAPERVYFVPLCVFLVLSWPVLAAGCLVLERGGVAVAHTHYRGVLRWTALAIPGIALSGLLADLVDAAGAMPRVIEETEVILFLAMAVPAWILADRARPTRSSHWALFGILLAVLQISTVSASMVTAWLVAPFADSGSFIMPVAVVVPMVLVPLAVIRIAKAVTGPGGPWRPAKQGKTDKAERA